MHSSIHRLRTRVAASVYQLVAHAFLQIGYPTLPYPFIIIVGLTIILLQ